MSEDLIRRSDAIEAIEVVDWYHQNSNKDMVSGANSDEHQAWYKADDVYKALEAVPTIEPKRGEWVDTHKTYCGSTVYACSECKSEINEMPTFYDKPMYKFCPYCDADMRAKEGE